VTCPPSFRYCLRPQCSTNTARAPLCSVVLDLIWTNKESAQSNKKTNLQTKDLIYEPRGRSYMLTISLCSTCQDPSIIEWLGIVEAGPSQESHMPCGHLDLHILSTLSPPYSCALVSPASITYSSWTKLTINVVLQFSLRPDCPP
jgi:hypothetical protein